jgi:3-oxosteroid 1-dehydrogenase
MATSPATTFDHSYDVIVVGSGAAGMSTAMGAADEGLNVLILESAETWGGNTARSGGGMWLPNNPLMRRDGVGDSREDALTYLEATVGDEGRSTSRARKEAYVDSVDDFVLTAEKYGMRFARAAEYPDYYPELPGGKIGRSIEVEPFDTHRIGEWWERCEAPAALPLKTDDVWLVSRSWSTVSGMVRGAQVVGRALRGAVRRQRLAGIGAGLASAFLDIVVQQQGTELWLESPLEELLIEDGRVVGVRTTRDGRPITIGATRGVMLAGGGFEHNAAWRLELQGVEGHSSGAHSNVGSVIALAREAGAATELMDDAWWGGSVAAPPGGEPAFIVAERSLPHSLMVDAQGDRFVNESESYVDLGHHMLEHDKNGAYWLVMDAQFTRRYLRTFALDPKGNRAMREAGILVKAPTLAELARGIDVDPTRLTSTVDRFNAFSRAGIDGDFGRGNSAYDRYYGDPLNLPNPNLGTVEKGPFTAYRVVVGDLGTKGGVVADEHSRALREDGTPIAGLYTSGNTSASPMGRTYPGPGSTLGPAVVFGMRAARHMARAPRPNAEGA